MKLKILLLINMGKIKMCCGNLRNKVTIKSKKIKRINEPSKLSL